MQANNSMAHKLYFLDSEFPDQSICRYEGDIETRGQNFNINNPEMMCIEASPNYLYSPSAPLKIKNAITDARSHFILRKLYDC
jgi:hypothetical protein